MAYARTKSPLGICLVFTKLAMVLLSELLYFPGKTVYIDLSTRVVPPKVGMNVGDLTRFA